MSRDYVKFMEIMKYSVKLQNGHYCLKIPFKKGEVSLPNNQCIAKQRILCTNFLSDILSEGYAEHVPEHQVEQSICKVWYIPHHGVYHPKKQTLCVVFDCGAEFRGKSQSRPLPH